MSYSKLKTGIAIIALGLLSACHPLAETPKTATVTIRSNHYTAEISDTEAERELGLMNRSQLGINSGMLFVFDSPDYYAFYMKNTLISLDIIWISPAKKIVYMVRHATPLDESSLIPTAPAKWVLELNAGQVSANGFEVGDSVDIQ